MERVDLQNGVSLSRIVYGMWRIAEDKDTSPTHVRAKIDACLDQGITSIDQADIYGGYTAESFLGAALKADPALREKIEIVTKCDIVLPSDRYPVKVKHYDTSRAHIQRAVEASLRDLQTDYIDLLLLHRPDPLMDHQETGAALDEVVASGKVRSVGVSNFRPWDWELLQSGMKTRLATNQIEISLARLDPLTDGDLAFHQRQADPIMAWSPLGGGSLVSGESELISHMDNLASEFGVERSAVAIAFLLHHPAPILPVMGTNTIARIATISDALKVKLDRETWFLLYQAGLGQPIP